LLDVPRYDFNWQHNYAFADAVPVHDDTRLEFEAVFDNSAGNPVNPDPAQYVSWGDQTWEEMAVAFVDAAFVRSTGSSGSAGGRAAASGSRRETAAGDTAASRSDSAGTGDPEGAVTAEKQRRIDRHLEELFAKLDRNTNGTIQRSECDLLFRRFTFEQYDGNRDGTITRAEAADTLRQYLVD
jgi:hypothetical protein